MEPATEDQIAYIQKLLVDHEDRDELSQIRSDKISKWDASTVIDSLLTDNWDEAENILRASLEGK